MIKFLLLTILTSNITYASNTVSAKYTVSKIIKKGDKSLIGFVESSTFYEAGKKELNCIQNSIKMKKKVEVKYDFKTYRIESCEILK